MPNATKAGHQAEPRGAREGPFPVSQRLVSMDCASGHDEKRLAFHGCPEDEVAPGPGVHALIVGTSEYPPRPGRRFPNQVTFQSIPGAAVGAARFADFLIHEFHDPTMVPLRTVRLLLTPTEKEAVQLRQLGARSMPATIDHVKQALEDWFLDCDQDPNNVALSYFAGHGIVTTAEVPFVFLSEANSRLDGFEGSINLYKVKEAMRYCRAVSNIYVFDCCAVIDPMLEPSGAGLSLPQRVRDVEQRSDELAICGARVGESAYALGETHGTLLSWALLPVLRTAGELRGCTFTITDARVDKELKVTVQNRPGGWRLAGQEPRVRGSRPAGITRPDPPPTFDGKFVTSGLPAQQPVELIVRDENREVVLRSSLEEGRSVPYSLQAGCYEVETVAPGDRRTFQLRLERPEPVAIPNHPGR